MLAPTLGFIPYGNMHATYVSDHFLYVACVGPFAMAGLGLQSLSAMRFARLFLPVLARSPASCSSRLRRTSMAYSGVFKSSQSMWTRALWRAPRQLRRQSRPGGWR